MPEISFYHLHSLPLEKALPKLLEKVHQSGVRALVLRESEEKAEEISKIMWTYTTKYFLPHGTKQDGFSEDQPIYITASNENPNGATILAIADGLDLEIESEFAQPFKRILDLFDGNNEEQLQRARARWKKYKEQGHSLTYWKQNEKGGWEKNE